MDYVMLIIKFRPDTPHPWLELGDPVSVPTDRFIGRGVESDRAFRGRATFYGTVVEHDMNGTEFSVWVPDLETALLDPVDVLIDYGQPDLELVDQRVLPIAASGGDQRSNRDVTLVPAQSCFSYVISYVFARTNAPPASPTFIGSTYFIDVATPGLSETHTLRAGGSTSAQTFVIRPTTYAGAQADISFSLRARSSYVHR